MGKKKMEASIGDLFAYLAKNTYRLRAVDRAYRVTNPGPGGWNFYYGSGVHCLYDTEILADLGKRTKNDDAPYRR